MSQFIGAKLAYFRSMRGLSVNALSKLVGISPTTLSRYEQGLTEPDIDALARICKVLYISADLFFEELQADSSRDSDAIFHSPKDLSSDELSQQSNIFIEALSDITNPE